MVTIKSVRILAWSVLLPLTLWLGSGQTETGANESAEALIFSHALHVVEQEIECATCHTEVETSMAAADRNYPEMDVCGDCHDVDDDDACGQCHPDPDDPMAVPDIDPTMVFSHQNHLGRKAACEMCHTEIASSSLAHDDNLPIMAACMACHDGQQVDNRCDLCHVAPSTLADIHPEGWRHQHGDRATSDADYCVGCHRQESFCSDCHRGDNLDGHIHDLNYRYTHGLDVQSKSATCNRCHDQRAFCNDCHQAELRLPLNHSKFDWKIDHGQAARNDVEICASCHDSGDPTCARSGCHRDSDGIAGTDARIHPRDLGRFDSEGTWHGDGLYFCYNCHTNTRLAGIGFCGYCHGEQ